MAGAFDESQEDRTETATAFRREEMRKQGVVAQSKEVLSVILFFSSGLAMYFVLGNLLVQFKELSHTFFEFKTIEVLTTKSVHELLIKGLTSWGVLMGPLFAVVMVAGFIGGVIQVGFTISTDPLTPNWERINPIKGFQRLFSLDALTEALKALIKMAIVFGVTWVFLKGRAFSVGNYFQKSVPELTSLIVSDLARLFFILVFSLACFAAIDFFYQRYRIEKQMKMSRREIKDEYKLREGDPLIKSRMRSAQRKIARRRMMEAVPKADVIITNPTHFSVAIQYDPKKMKAPRVVAKGVDFLALRIRELAKASGVPIVENRPLARALYKQIPVGKPITEDLYTAVAQVLSYVYRLKGISSMAA
jgi:flagellar biosynthesis protein FlhB